MRKMVLALAAGAMLGLSGCGYFYPFADNRARAAVEAMNLRDVKLQRTVIGLSCSKSDKIFYKFFAHNVQGRPIRGVVCMSYFKGATVRITG
ncbi:MAG TPA: hypothetical protein VF459_04335 [Caulobacteraceae bacterium]